MCQNSATKGEALGRKNAQNFYVTRFFKKVSNPTFSGGVFCTVSRHDRGVSLSSHLQGQPILTELSVSIGG